MARLTKLLADANSQKDAVAAITRLHGGGVDTALCYEMKAAVPAQRVKLLEVLVARRAFESVPVCLDATKDADPGVRIAALEGLGQLGGPDLVSPLARLILDAPDAATREKTERALMLIAQRNPKDNMDKQALPLLGVMSGLSEKERTALLPALGRIGGKPALEVVEAALADKDPARSAAGLRALCNWPDGSVAARLVELALAAQDPAGRKLLVDALIRVAPLPDKRSEAERLAMVKRAMELASSDEQRTLILKRASAVRSLETLRFVVPYLDKPKFTQMACLSVVELAHHKEFAAAEQGRVREGPQQGPRFGQGPRGDSAGEPLSEGRDVGREADQGAISSYTNPFRFLSSHSPTTNPRNNASTGPRCQSGTGGSVSTGTCRPAGKSSISWDAFLYV